MDTRTWTILILFGLIVIWHIYRLVDDWIFRRKKKPHRKVNYGKPYKNKK